MHRNETEGVAFTAVDSAKLGVANADCVLQHGREHRLKIAGELLTTRSTSDVAVCCSR